jgi:pimeloyl-ACP methyl ester carboxylesterase/LysM repeat protein
MACVVEATGQEILDALEMASRNTMAEYVSESVDENGNKVYNAVGEMGGFLQVSGMKYTINTAVESTVKTDDKGSFVSVEGARRVQDVQVLNQTTNTYEPIDPAKTYTLASHNYMLKSGGDGINMFQDNKLLQDEVKIDNQVLIDYIVDSLGGNVGEQYKNLAGEGRITVVNETKPALKDNEYALSTELPDGAKVVFVNRSVSKAMSAANSEGSAYNRAGVDVTPVDGILTTDNDEIVWTVEKTEGGFFLKRTDGKKLSIGNKPDGGTYNSMGFDQEDNPVWKIAPAATDGCIYLQSATATGSSGDPKSVEWYAQYSNFSMYYVNSSNEIPAYITTPKGYKADGSFPFVVMIHGHGGNHNESDGFDKISNGLAEQGFVVATLDLPGCGKSKESFQLNTMTNMKADVLDVIDYVCKNYAVDKTRIGAFGYSMGGRITLELLAEGKYSFSTIELVAPAEDLTDLKNLFGGAEKWDTMKAEANEKGYVEFTTKYGQHQQLSKEWFADLEKYSDGLVEKAAENYTGDSLVIWATNDEAVSPSVSSAVATTLGSATLNTYADGHSYSFYGTTEYTISTVNNGSVNYFVNELKTNETRIHGYVQSIAKYGNLELTIPGSELDKAGFEYGDLLKITVDGKEFTVPYGTNYSDVDQGSTILRNSDGHLTLAINMGDFAGKNGIATKKTNEDKTYEWYYAAETNIPAVVTIEMGEKGGYYDEWLIHQLVRTNNREDYKHLSDAEFASFRNVATTGMGENALYRSSSPINDEIGRNTYADKAAEAAGVRTFMNLANDEATAKGYEGFDSTYYSKQNVVYLNLGVDFTAADFKTGLATGLRYFTTHEGPYLVHCTEGKDRAGFVSALLECLMGATYDEVVADYMTTYVNYYHLEEGSEQYEAVKNSNIVSILTNITGAAEGTDLTTVDLAAAAEDYMLDAGLTADEVTALKANLAKDYTVETEAPAEETPEEPVPQAQTYTVEAGDCLWNIAYEVYGTGTRWTVIYEANRDTIRDPGMIHIGQVLTIPAA